jgi:hypothetical protein
MNKYKQNSKRLRGSDLGESFPANVRLENNYCRGFQQGLVFLFFVMKEMELENVSALDVFQASNVAGLMRLRKSHPRWYGEAFIDEFCKTHLKRKRRTTNRHE